jgi:hypothetical protein
MTAALALKGPEPVDTKPAADDIRHWSVTTIIGVLDKPALVPWAAKETATAAVTQQRAWQGIAEQDPDEAIKWLSAARFRTGKGLRSATDLGRAVHAGCEDYALTGTRPALGDTLSNGETVDAEMVPYLDRFDEWLQQFTPAYQAVEVTVFNPAMGYAGTTDGFLTIDGVRTIVDYKTSRKSIDYQGNPTKPWPEVGLQLAAYRFAELAAVWRPRRYEQFRRRYYLLSEAERAQAVPVPTVDGGLCIHITPDHCVAYPVRCDEQIFERFLFVLEAAAFPLEQAATIIGQPLTPRED